MYGNWWLGCDPSRAVSWRQIRPRPTVSSTPSLHFHSHARASPPRLLVWHRTASWPTLVGRLPTAALSSRDSLARVPRCDYEGLVGCQGEGMVWAPRPFPGFVRLSCFRVPWRLLIGCDYKRTPSHNHTHTQSLGRTRRLVAFASTSACRTSLSSASAAAPLSPRRR